jgi:hypothetical protein
MSQNCEHIGNMIPAINTDAVFKAALTTIKDAPLVPHQALADVGTSDRKNTYLVSWRCEHPAPS